MTKSAKARANSNARLIAARLARFADGPAFDGNTLRQFAAKKGADKGITECNWDYAASELNALAYEVYF